MATEKKLTSDNVENGDVSVFEGLNLLGNFFHVIIITAIDQLRRDAFFQRLSVI